MVIDAGDSRTRGRAARFPIDSKLGTSLPPFLGQQVSIDQAGGSENMVKASNVDVGIANVWTISMWLKPDGTPSSNTRYLTIGTTNSFIDVRAQNAGGGLAFSTANSAGSNLKNYEINSVLSDASWSFVCFSWDGTNLVLYHQGSEVAPDAQDVDNSGTMANDTRAVGVGGLSVANAALSFDGNLHSYAIWDVELSADAISELYNSGAGEAVSYDEDGTNYTSSADLLHWWRLGLASGDIGKDYGTHSTLIDVMDDATGIDATDIVASYPGE